MAAVPSIGRAARIEGSSAPEADVTRDLYERYANQIFRYCLHQLGSREEAEDAVQSTFLNAFRGIKRGVVPELESAWLFKIAHNVCLSRRRSAWRRGRIESPADFEVVEELTPAPSRRSDELIGLQDVLEQMPESQRRAILLREWQGLSYREIADELTLSQAAVETLIFRARRSLAAGLEQPVEVRRRRIARAFDWSNIATALKSALVGGSVAAKVAATVAVVSATTVAATAPVVQHRPHHFAPDRAPAPAKPRARTVVHATAPVVVAPHVSTPAPVVSAPPVRRAVVHHHPLVPAWPKRTQAHIATPAPAPPAPVETQSAPVEPTQGAQAGESPHGQAGDEHGNGHAYGRSKHDTREPSAVVSTPAPAPAEPSTQTPAAPSDATAGSADGGDGGPGHGNGHGEGGDANGGGNADHGNGDGHGKGGG